MAVSALPVLDLHTPCRNAPFKPRSRPPIDRHRPSACIPITVENFISFFSPPQPRKPVRLPRPRSATFNPRHHPPRLKTSHHNKHNANHLPAAPPLHSASSPPTALPVAPSSAPAKLAERPRPQISGTHSIPPPAPSSSPPVIPLQH